jgi:hypothetical protein
MHNAFVHKPSIVAQQWQLPSQPKQHCHFEITATISPHTTVPGSLTAGGLFMADSTKFKGQTNTFAMHS